MNNSHMRVAKASESRLRVHDERLMSVQTKLAIGGLGPFESTRGTPPSQLGSVSSAARFLPSCPRQSLRASAQDNRRQAAVVLGHQLYNSSCTRVLTIVYWLRQTRAPAACAAERSRIQFTLWPKGSLVLSIDSPCTASDARACACASSLLAALVSARVLDNRLSMKGSVVACLFSKDKNT